MHTKESVQKELSRIQSSVPSTYRENLFLEQEANPTIAKVLREALKKDVSKEKREEWTNLLAEAEQKVQVENPKRAKMIDDFIQREIKKSVKAGKLPTRAELIKLKLYEK